MTNIDTAVAALLASRVDSLLSIASRSNASTAQTGTSALTVDTPTARGAPVSLLDNPPQASAQTILSRIALTLDAIMRSGGDATPSLVGQLPIWPVVPALEEGIGAQPGATPDGTAAEANAGNGAATATPSQTSQTSQAQPQTGAAQGAAGVTPGAGTVPVDALAAALRQTVNESGLFYESHLAQWLGGQRPPASLFDEPQNRLVAEASQMPLPWTLADDAAADGEGLASWWHGGSSAQPGSGSAPSNPGAAHQASGTALPMSARFAAAVQEFAEDAFGSGPSTQSARDGAQPGNINNGQSNAAQASFPTQAMAASVHQATVTLVRQQLDLLATGEFRWSGEAWPGARLDWSIEEAVDRWSRGGDGDASELDEIRPWRTRLTLSLPVLGTVDADLTLVGMQLTARVQASPTGAARLAAQGESFRQRLAAVGIALNALAIREIVGGGPSEGLGSAASVASATQAAQAYARSAAASAAAAGASHPAGDAQAGNPAAAPFDLFDGDELL
ncbi:flagellar hook-length control protein FliK [Paraburkholderia rhizosphaerae]|uniref:Flagellar hook-length control protein FliK n=1 Tax=Paraburkholderia rhizosphaerae TaxID=480658 RepID=A0A4R8LWC5_9BURK|nr:flagellar hook-length control protein FliK [Paraburkholderia rhizosphaerae]TDY51918.1 flagellar hook-length control protein FliK [Paraburkholderia rhizosphaerae]